jgi:hypothetical protein
MTSASINLMASVFPFFTFAPVDRQPFIQFSGAIRVELRLQPNKVNYRILNAWGSGKMLKR